MVKNLSTKKPVKPPPKKRGRKPKGGKIVKNIDNKNSDRNEIKTNIILHLKHNKFVCSECVMILFLKEEWFFYLTKYFLNNKHIIHLSSSSFNEIDSKMGGTFIKKTFVHENEKKWEVRLRRGGQRIRNQVVTQNCCFLK